MLEPEQSPWIPPRSNPEVDRRCTGLAAAVEFAQSSNLLGIFITAKLLVRDQFFFYHDVTKYSQNRVPSLSRGVRDSGLLLGAFGNPRDIEAVEAIKGENSCELDATLKSTNIAYFVDHTALAI